MVQAEEHTWGRIQRKTLYMGPNAGVDYNPTLCPLQIRFQHIFHGQPYVIVDLNHLPESTLSPRTLDLASDWRKNAIALMRVSLMPKDLFADSLIDNTLNDCWLLDYNAEQNRTEQIQENRWTAWFWKTKRKNTRTQETFFFLKTCEKGRRESRKLVGFLRQKWTLRSSSVVSTWVPFSLRKMTFKEYACARRERVWELVFSVAQYVLNACGWKARQNPWLGLRTRNERRYFRPLNVSVTAHFHSYYVTLSLTSGGLSQD